MSELWSKLIKVREKQRLLFSTWMMPFKNRVVRMEGKKVKKSEIYFDFRHVLSLSASLKDPLLQFRPATHSRRGWDGEVVVSCLSFLTFLLKYFKGIVALRKPSNFSYFVLYGVQQQSRVIFFIPEFSTNSLLVTSQPTIWSHSSLNQAFLTCAECCFFSPTVLLKPWHSW